MCCRNKRKAAGDDSDLQEEDNLMTDQQREEEAMLKHTFNFYMSGKGGVNSLERYELPMMLDGKYSNHNEFPAYPHAKAAREQSLIAAVL